MSHPDIGSKGHDLKENKGGIKVGGKKNANGCTQRQKQKQIITVSVSVMGKVLFGKKSAHHPHKRCNSCIQRPEPIQCKMKSEAAHIRNRKRKGIKASVHSANQQEQKYRKGDDSDTISKIITNILLIPSQQIRNHSSCHWEKHTEN